MTASLTPHSPDASIAGGDFELASARISQEPVDVEALLAKVAKLERSLAQRDRRIVRLLGAMDYARARGIKFLGDEQLMTRGISPSTNEAPR